MVRIVVCSLVVVALSAASGAPARAAGPTAGCAWAGETDQRDVNIGAPDLDAFYWLDTLVPQLGTRAAITGSYPRARYFSFHVYDGAGNALGSIYDAQIRPDRGSANPYQGPVPHSAHNRYTLHVEFAPKPAHPAANTLYVDPSAGATALLVYRIYVPQSQADPSGSAPYPGVRLETTQGLPLLTQGACATTPPPFGSPLWELSAAADYPAAAPRGQAPRATRIPTWSRSFGNQLGNEQNAYLAAQISRQYGDIVVIHTRAPTFPDTRRGRAPYGNHQLRYWSFCSYDAQGQAVIGCVADYGAAIRKGAITYVVSDPGARPTNAKAAAGVTWLPWGGTQASAQLVYRNMLPSKGFRYAAQRIKPTSNAAAVMGPYYPTAAYCSKRLFELGGWKGCFRAAGLHLPAAPGCSPDGPLIRYVVIAKRGPRRVLRIGVRRTARLTVRAGSRVLVRRRLRACRSYTLAIPQRHQTLRVIVVRGRTRKSRTLHS